jgi:two-component system, LytTR family, response regulator
MTTSVKLLQNPLAETPIIAVRPTTVFAQNKRNKSKIALPCMEGLVFEKCKHILYLEAEGNYTMIHFVDKRNLMVCKTLRELEEMLPQKKFVRIHRSHTVNLKYVQKYIKGKSGYVLLTNKKALHVSIGQRETLVEALHNYFTM